MKTVEVAADRMAFLRVHAWLLVFLTRMSGTARVRMP